MAGMQEQLLGLEEQVAERDTELEKLQEQLLQLTEDFRYNLKVEAATLRCARTTCTLEQAQAS